MPNALVVVANGSEEIETVGIVDTLRRGEIEVTLAKVPSETDDDSLIITASRQVKLVADVHFKDVSENEFDIVVLPGGMGGAKSFAAHEPLIEKLTKQKNAGKWYAALCASPAIVFAPHKLLDGIEKATCHPGTADTFKKHCSTECSKDRVVVAGKCVTSRGPGTTLEFSLKLVELLLGNDTKANEIQKAMLVK
jgi:4-methyl-5(b-hydroxyethyl)-thiazole monophosphate biosynthesis